MNNKIGFNNYITIPLTIVGTILTSYLAASTFMIIATPTFLIIRLIPF